MSNKKMRVLHVVTNVDQYADGSAPTGLWLSEFTHAYDVFEQAGAEQQVVSPKGGAVPLEPRALKWPYLDKSTQRRRQDAHVMHLLADSASADELKGSQFDVIYFTGGHGVMWDFPDDAGLQRLTREVYEHGGVVASVCHGYCGLLNVPLSDGSLLVKGRQLTGFSWAEERLAGVAKNVPYNVEKRMRQRGAVFKKGLLPFMSKVVVDGRLVTGQNPNSARRTAQSVLQVLKAA